MRLFLPITSDAQSSLYIIAVRHTLKKIERRKRKKKEKKKKKKKKRKKNIGLMNTTEIKYYDTIRPSSPFKPKYYQTNILQKNNYKTTRYQNSRTDKDRQTDYPDKDPSAWKMHSTVSSRDFVSSCTVSYRNAKT